MRHDTISQIGIRLFFLDNQYAILFASNVAKTKGWKQICIRQFHFAYAVLQFILKPSISLLVVKWAICSRSLKHLTSFTVSHICSSQHHRNAMPRQVSVHFHVFQYPCLAHLPMPNIAATIMIQIPLGLLINSFSTHFQVDNKCINVKLPMLPRGTFNQLQL